MTAISPGAPGWRPSLVVLDLDGTVVPYSNVHIPPSPRVSAAVAAVLAGGVPVTIATGRAVWNALPTAADLGLHGIELVCSNGAVVYDADAHQVLHAATIDPAPAARALSDRRSGLDFAVEHGVRGFRTTAGFPRDFPSEFLESGPLAEIVAEPTTRLVCRFAPALGSDSLANAHGEAAEIAAELAEQALDPGTYSWEIGYTGWIDVVAPGVSKASGVAMLAADLGIGAEEILAIGDGANDLPLFAWAGYSIAMGQSPHQVQRAADEVTLPVAEDGVAVVLERWFS